jgi:hypothetical protein
MMYIIHKESEDARTIFVLPLNGEAYPVGQVCEHLALRLAQTQTQTQTCNPLPKGFLPSVHKNKSGLLDLL